MSRLRIFPPVATVYPLDHVIFTAEAAPPPPMWFASSASSDVKSDFSLEVDAAQAIVDGNGAHALRSGLGAIEFTIDDQSRPTSTAILALESFISDVSAVSYQYKVRITSSTVKVFNESESEIFTTNHTLISGDIFRVELQAGFRLFMNGVLLHSRLGLPSTVVYPMGYIFRLEEPTATAPTRVPPPKLIGDWRLSPGAMEWVSPSHGLISSIASTISTEYYAGTVVGSYTLKAAIGSAMDAGGVQTATATIIIPALTILGDDEVTLQPGEKVRFKTNYDAAQGKLITWSVVSGGGSFTQDEFTADTAPGLARVRATSSINGLSADIQITVAAKITNASNFIAAKPSEQIDFETNIPVSTIPQLLGAGGVGVSVIDGTVPLPTGVQEGDLLLMIVQTANQAVSAPSGWTETADSPQGTGTGGAAGSVRLTAFYRRWTLGVAAPIIADPGDHFVAQIVNLRGVITSGNPWDVTAGDTAASTTAVSIPGDTTTVINTLVVAIVANASDTDSPQVTGFTNASLSSFAERGDFNTSTAVGGGFAYAAGGKATAGAYNATTATLGNASAQGRLSLAFKPSALAWFASIGSINGTSGLWTAPSLPGQTALITVTNGLFTVTIEVPVLEVFPFDPTAVIKWERRKTVLVSTAEDRTRSSRVKDKSGLAFEAWEVTYRNKTVAELATAMAFFDAHFPGKRFIFEDKLRNLRKVVYFDSNISVEGGADCAVDFSFRIVEG